MKRSRTHLHAQIRPRCAACGSALLVVLWSLIVLSAAIFAYARWIQVNVQMHGYASQTTEARAMAHSGVVVALHPKVDKQSPQLEQTFAADLGFRARIISEGGKLNLNWLARGEDPRKIVMLKQWLERRGLNHTFATTTLPPARPALKLMTSAPGFAAARASAARRLPAPASARFVTVKVVGTRRDSNSWTESLHWPDLWANNERNIPKLNMAWILPWNLKAVSSPRGTSIGGERDNLRATGADIIARGRSGRIGSVRFTDFTLR